MTRPKLMHHQCSTDKTQDHNTCSPPIGKYVLALMNLQVESGITHEDDEATHIRHMERPQTLRPVGLFSTSLYFYYQT